MSLRKAVERERYAMLSPLMQGYWEGILISLSSSLDDDAEVFAEEHKGLFRYFRDKRRFLDDPHGILLWQALSGGRLSSTALASPTWEPHGNIALDESALRYAVELEAVYVIWKQAISECPASEIILPPRSSSVSFTQVNRWISLLASRLGTTTMLDAYDGGIPLEDLLA